ncbi:hypothetical protein NYZ42_18385, partial [Acinetobacter baumannii]|nr:hypothetical protein [Acinetobacter baumannii]
MRSLATAAAFRVALVAAGILIPTLASANELERDGYKFNYTRSVTDKGDTVLAGTVTSSGEAFRLVVRDRTVSGDVGGRPVR